MAYGPALTEEEQEALNAKDWLCESCGVNPGCSLQTCPYGEEICEDYSLCNCCDDCTYECTMDI